jgi:hypothetical protein
MTRNLWRRIEKLERNSGGAAAWQVKLRVLARRFGCEEEAFFEAIRGYERRLAAAIDNDGAITWEDFLLVRNLLSKRSPK